MTDELITQLAKLGNLRVISRTSVMRYKGTRESLPEIARQLNVDAIVEGSVARSGNRKLRAWCGASLTLRLGLRKSLLTEGDWSNTVLPEVCW